jgi:hypothetical protein
MEETIVGSRVRLLIPGDAETTLRCGALGSVTEVGMDGERVSWAKVEWDAGQELTVRPWDQLWEVLPPGTKPAVDHGTAISDAMAALRDAGVSPFEVANAAILNLESAGLIGHHGPLTLLHAFLIEQQLRQILIRNGYNGRNEDPLIRLAEDAVACAYGGMVAESPTNAGWDVRIWDTERCDSGGIRIQVKAATVPKNAFASWKVGSGEFDVLVALAVSQYSGDVLYAYEFERAALDAVLPGGGTLTFNTAHKNGVDVTEKVQHGLEISTSPSFVSMRLDDR